MITILIPIILLLTAAILSHRRRYEDIAAGCFIFGLVFSIFVALVWPLKYYSSCAELEQHNSLKQTIELARKSNIGEIERAALLTKIAEHNMGLAQARYWNDSIFDVYISDDLARLEPLK